MLARGGAVWFGIMLMAIFNGAFRDVVLTPRLGDLGARAVSCFTLASVIVLVTWISLPWVRPVSTSDAWRVGWMWLAMTLAFEFGAGHYILGTSWTALLADYNLLAGRLWILVLAATLTAPAMVYIAAHNHVNDAEFYAISSETRRDTGNKR